MESNTNRKMSKKAEGFQGLIINGMLTALFIFAIISGGIYLASNNGQNSTLLNNTAINNTFNSLEDQLPATQTIAEQQKNNTFLENPIEGSDSFLFGTIIGAAKVFTGVWRSFYDLTFGLMSETLGISPVILGVITAILLVVILLLFWRLIKVGE